MRNVSDKCRGNKNKRLFVNNSFFSENRAVYEIMWKTIVQRCRPQMTIRRTRIACWIPKATHSNTLEICYTYRISTAKIVARARRNATFMPTLPVFS
jgi:hypothetical protein